MHWGCRQYKAECSIYVHSHPGGGRGGGENHICFCSNAIDGFTLWSVHFHSFLKSSLTWPFQIWRQRCHNEHRHQRYETILEASQIPVSTSLFFLTSCWVWSRDVFEWYPVSFTLNVRRRVLIEMDRDRRQIIFQDQEIWNLSSTAPFLTDWLCNLKAFLYHTYPSVLGSIQVRQSSTLFVFPVCRRMWVQWLVPRANSEFHWLSFF